MNVEQWIEVIANVGIVPALVWWIISTNEKREARTNEETQKRETRYFEHHVKSLEYMNDLVSKLETVSKQQDMITTTQKELNIEIVRTNEKVEKTNEKVESLCEIIGLSIIKKEGDK